MEPEKRLLDDDDLRAEIERLRTEVARPDDIPQATHEGVMELLGMKLRIYRLDDGNTVIHADDFHAFLKHSGFGEIFEQPIWSAERCRAVNRSNIPATCDWPRCCASRQDASHDTK